MLIANFPKQKPPPLRKKAIFANIFGVSWVFSIQKTKKCEKSENRKTAKPCESAEKEKVDVILSDNLQRDSTSQDYLQPFNTASLDENS